MSRAKSDKEKINLNEIKEQILDLLTRHPKKTFDLNKIVNKLEIRDKSTLIAISDALEELENTGKVQVNDRGGYRADFTQSTITGTVDYVNPRHAFIISSETETDVMVKAEDLKFAMDGDTVKVLIHAQSRPGKRTEGEVVEIIKRSRSEFVGRLELSTRYAFVVPDNRKMHYDIFVKLTSLKNAKHNDKVIVKITEWPGRDKNPSGEIINILGQAGDNEAEIHSIMAEFGLPFEFDPKVEEAAARISEEITEKEISNRRDMRDVFTITIDPEDAKDFDDAISLKHLENGNYEIGVHIADVAHYVKPDTILDEEAFNRATSVYLVDRTIPMLPEKLSNNLCSLRPHEDKLTFSAVFELDNNARLHKEWFGRTIIHSDRRFSYEEAQERIETQEGDYAKELLLLNQLALKLRVERFMKGSVNFETTEVKFKLDEKGKPLHYDIFVKLTSLKNAKHNDKVIVKITEWPGRDKNPSGEIINILGQAGDNEAEIHSIMAEFGLPFEFDPKVEEAAARISEEITEKEISNRRDMRDVFTITIDPEDAKDFDDAISLKHLENGNYEIGVHIADVAHYVKPDTILDEEAFNRATSVYLVDRTIPMLPEKLSNNLCSLRPHEDKLTFSAVFELDNNARLHKEWFGRTIIHSDRRFSYEEAQERIETQEGDYAKELLLLNQLALKLRVERFMKGSVNFETTEVKFKLDEKGKPLGVIPKVRKDAHKLIEDFMLLANKKVAEFVNNMKGGHGKEDGEGKSGKGKSGKTFVYRTHDYPDPEKLQTFSVFAQKFGHQLKTEEAAISKSLNALMDEIEGKPEQNVLQTLAIRTMAKAKYTTEAKGHFGLAFNHYTHFTSPIRRYPDVMVHRLLQHYLDKGKSVDKDNYEEKCVHSSEMEKRAADAERASIKYKQVEFMASVADKVFDGLVSGVTEWGIFVEIVETKCEGMVRMSDMDDDFYEFDEKNYRVIGKRNKKIITLGDKVQVTVKATDIDRRTIDLEFVNNERRTAGVHRSHKQRN